MEYGQATIVYLGLFCGLLHHGSSSDTVRTECRQNCVLQNGEIRGREGNDITLEYITNINASTFVDYTLRYDGKIVIKFIDIDATKVKVQQVNNRNPSYTIMPVKDRNEHITKNGTAASFIFTLKSLNRTVHSAKVLKSILNSNDAQGLPITKEESLTVNVYHGPKVIKQLSSSYDVADGELWNVTVVLEGNPAPVLKYNKTNQVYPSQQISTDTYQYHVHLNTDINSCGSRQVFIASVDNDATTDLVTTLIVAFTPGVPSVTSAEFKRDNCLEVAWNAVPSGQCNVTYSVVYNYHNGTWNSTTTNQLNIRECFGFNTSINGTVAVKATVGGLSSSFTPRIPVVEEPDPTEPPTTTVTPTGLGPEPVVGPANDSLEWYFILVIVIAILIVIIIVTCLVLYCTKRITCWQCCYEKTAPSSGVNGISNPDYEAEFEMKHSVRHLSNAAGLTRPGDREKNDNKESDYVDVRTMDTPKPSPPVSSTDYAELGPGGRAGEKPKVLPSFYAQVNTENAYYPPLNPENKAPPVYAVSSKVRPGGPNPSDSNPAAPVEPVYMSNALRPPSEYEDDEINPITV